MIKYEIIYGARQYLPPKLWKNLCSMGIFLLQDIFYECILRQRLKKCS